MKTLVLITTVLIFMSGFALAAPANEGRDGHGETVSYSSLAALATLEVVESSTRRYAETGFYSYYQDGNDLVLRKRPGRAKYGDITLEKGARCNVNDCDDGEGDVRPEIRMNKAELIEAIATESGLSKADAKRALDSFASSEVKAIKKGDTVTLVGIGSFYQEYCPKAREKAKKTACRSSIPDYLDPDDDGDGLPDEASAPEIVIEVPEQAFDILQERIINDREGNGGIDLGLKTKS